MLIPLEMPLGRSTNVVRDVSPDVVNAVGEILMGYALAESRLRAMMKKVDGHKPRSDLSKDINRLKRHKAKIVASVASVDVGQAMEEYIDAIINAFGKVHQRRNALAHGQLKVQHMVKMNVSLLPGGRNDQEHSVTYSIEHVDNNEVLTTVELTKDGIQESLDNVRELQHHIWKLGTLVLVTKEQESRPPTS